MNGVLLTQLGLAIGALAVALPGAQDRGAQDAPVVVTDPTAITQPDSGSSVDEPPERSPEPRTGAHEPVIELDPPPPPPHAEARARAACEQGDETACPAPPQ